MIEDAVIVQLACNAGFGGNARNTHLVKLIMFARAVEHYLATKKRVEPKPMADPRQMEIAFT